ncbi:histidinol-phosphate aminotransferase [Shimia sagamensis]|uniref:Histidinol-phosphate aminotransferase n=2 Tax=Shimia sagamensis TaxID=1566352 RepID=A0ABY1NXD2_9RHOB|nr:histidinol-phosphate aminotransferase [Shimia sagamensis]
MGFLDPTLCVPLVKIHPDVRAFALVPSPSLRHFPRMTGPRYTKLAESLPATVPFVGPEAQERAMGHPFAARIGANENIFGPSPKAIEAMQKAAGDIWMYGDPESFDLRHALAAHHDIAPENLVVGEGIDALLGYLVRLLICNDDAVVTSEGAYPTFNYHVAGFGGTLHKVPYRDDAEDLAALLTKASEVDAKLVYFANPDNPMGSWCAGEDIVAQLDNIPDGCLLLLDEAYVELAPDGTAPVIDINDPRVIRMRTFSKAYGMAGARVGYAIGETQNIRAFEKIRNHFGMNRAAQAGALAALQDASWLSETCSKVEASRQHITEVAAKHGLIALPSATNFVAIDCGKDGTYAKAILDGLVARGIFARMPFVAPQNRCIRVSCAPEAEITLLDKALGDALEDLA